MFEEIRCCKEIMKKHFKKERAMIKENERHFRCQTCTKLYSEEDIRVRGHCHITGKYRNSAHQICNLDYRLTKRYLLFFLILKDMICGI